MAASSVCLVEERDCLSHWGTDALLYSLINHLLPTVTESSQWNFRRCLFRSVILYLIRSNALFENKFFVFPSFLAWYHVMDIITHLHTPFQKVLILTKLLRQVLLFLDPCLGKSWIKHSPSQTQAHPVCISLQPKYPICLSFCFDFCLPWSVLKGSLLPSMLIFATRALGEEVSYWRKDLEPLILSSFLNDSSVLTDSYWFKFRPLCSRNCYSSEISLGSQVQRRK